MQFSAVKTPVSSFQLYLLISRDSSYCSVNVAMESFRSWLQQKGFVSFNQKGDGSCFFSAAAHQLKQDSACVKEVAFEYLLRLSSWEDQAGVIQAISPISVKLGQNEGYTRKTLQTKWVGFGIFLKVISPPPLVLGPKSSKFNQTQQWNQKSLLTTECKQFYYHFPWRKTGPLVAYYNSFKLYRLTRANQELSKPTYVTKGFAIMKFRSSSDPNTVKVQPSFGKPIISTYTRSLALTIKRIKFLASAFLPCQQPLKEHEQPPCLTERDRQIKGNNPLQD